MTALQGETVWVVGVGFGVGYCWRKVIRLGAILVEQLMGVRWPQSLKRSSWD